VQLGQVRDLVHLAARRFEEYGRADAAVNVTKRALRVCVERPGMGLCAADVSVDGGDEARLAELPQYRSAELVELEGGPSRA
jgi:hypothetical protein